MYFAPFVKRYELEGVLNRLYQSGAKINVILPVDDMDVQVVYFVEEEEEEEEESDD